MVLARKRYRWCDSDHAPARLHGKHELDCSEQYSCTHTRSRATISSPSSCAPHPVHTPRPPLPNACLPRRASAAALVAPIARPQPHEISSSTATPAEKRRPHPHVPVVRESTGLLRPARVPLLCVLDIRERKWQFQHQRPQAFAQSLLII